MSDAQGGATLVFSPHLDDAVLSAFTVLAGEGEVIVVNVCDAVPPPGPPTFAVRLAGASDRVRYVRRRRQEDDAALAAVGRRSVGLGFLDVETREHELEAGAIARATAAALPTAARLVAPMAIGQHPDHELTRRAAVALAMESGIPLDLYADLPWATACGWPHWVTGEPADPHLDPMVAWESALSAPERLGEPAVVPLGPALLQRKRAALAAYVSQLSMLAGGPTGHLDDWALRFEVFWPVRDRSTITA